MLTGVSIIKKSTEYKFHIITASKRTLKLDLSLYLIFLTTTVMLILIPGPAAITVASQGATNTSNKAFFGVLGVATADVIFFALSATGIASLIIASNLMFSAVNRGPSELTANRHKKVYPNCFLRVWSSNWQTQKHCCTSPHYCLNS